VTTLPVGHHAVLVEVEDAAAARSLAAWARGQEVPADEIVPAARTVLFDGVPDPTHLAELLAGWSPSAGPETGELVELPMSYDGPDLRSVAERWGMTEEEAVTAHSDVEYVAAFCGFAPGSTRWSRPAGGACSAPPTPSCGTRPARIPPCWRPAPG